MKRNTVANKRRSATPDASLAAKRLADEQLKLVAGAEPKVGTINIGDGATPGAPNEPSVLS